MQLKRTTLTALLIVLATLSFATAAITLTNITEWHVQSAGTPPIVKVAGTDATGSLLSVSTYTASDGTNRTVITIKGYTGDPTYYSEAIKICNTYGTSPFTVSLKYNGVLSGSWTYVKYLKLWLGTLGPLTIDSSTNVGATLGSVTLNPGQCVSVPAEVLVDASTPSSQWNKDLVTIEVDVVSTG
ncbi:MAG: hypothetical protein JHC26_09520 [Thermofilum sp.]|uniref:hypothetical protein n=1 Tax=Thermofilum sp. TaxID=1961369 RepID=UPI0025837727|nr:hypothetical protein [Thermofilum sp.]MCI4409320.1 hypothetical protein [Thermofilum sp.]